ncbi:Hypothetical predicted protein [Octopus vulgaris]|uniref:Uncharacterized protein n=1 Tax=Octopus vulgaris TaxID=6645 RepID=A0AA36EWV3_OCTVU|nr:Hypothetical predicted protein [Octopus vulgaris]
MMNSRLTHNNIYLDGIGTNSQGPQGHHGVLTYWEVNHTGYTKQRALFPSRREETKTITVETAATTIVNIRVKLLQSPFLKHDRLKLPQKRYNITLMSCGYGEKIESEEEWKSTQKRNKAKEYCSPEFVIWYF